MAKQLTVEDKFTKARIVLLKGDPFIGKYLLLLDKPIECGGKDSKNNFPILNDLKTMATTGTSLYYNREFVDKLTFEEFLFILLHQLLHCTTMHMARSLGKNEKVWNLACDLWVNSRLKDRQKEYRDTRNISYDLYKDELFSTDRKILNLSVDDIYSEFMEQYTTQVGDSGDEVGPGGEDDEVILESGSHTIKLGDYNPDMIKPEDVGESSADLVDQISEMNGASYVHSELVGTSTKLLSEQEIGMQRAQTKWYKYFDRHLKKVFNHDTSYTTPDRNLLYTRRIYKGPMKATSDKLNQVIVAMDCSSSVWDDKESMEKFWFHINNIMKKYQAEGKVLLWDGEVGLELELAKFRVNKKYDLPKGGTDPISVFNYISNNRIKYDVLVMLTDEYFKEKDFEKIESLDDKKTIWVISGKHKAFKRLEEYTDKAKVAKL